MASIQATVCMCDTPCETSSWAYSTRSHDSCPIFDSETMNYMILGTGPREDNLPWIQGFISFKDIFIPVVSHCTWIPICGSTCPFELSIFNDYDDVIVLGTVPFRPSIDFGL